MPTRIAYVAGDPHFPEEPGTGSWRSEPAVVGDVFFALEQVVALCVRDKAQLLIPGDVFDGPDPDPKVLAEVYSRLRPLADNRLSVYSILGNHDHGRDWLAPMGSCSIRLDNRLVTLGASGPTVTGLSHVPLDQLPAALEGVRPADIGLYHQNWTEWSPGGRSVSVSVLPPHRLAVCGDIHVRAVTRPPRGPVLVLSPGPLVPQSTAEFGPPQVYAVLDDFTVEAVPIRGRTYARYEVDSPEAAEATLTALAGLAPDKALPKGLRAPMAVARLTVPVDGFAEAFRKLAADRGVVARLTEPKRPKGGKGGGPVVAGGLAAALVGRRMSRAATKLALDLTADGADRKAVLTECRLAYEKTACASSVSNSRTSAGSGATPSTCAAP